MKKKIQENLTFNKASVILMYIMVICLFLFCYITQQYPPAEFTYCWFIFWIAQAIITCVLQINKRKSRRHEQERISFFEAITPYINEENVNSIIEKYTGISPKYKVRQHQKEEIKR